MCIETGLNSAHRGLDQFVRIIEGRNNREGIFKVGIKEEWGKKIEQL
jgi:hypothetical protein